MSVLYVDDDEAICWLLGKAWKKTYPHETFHAAQSTTAGAKVMEDFSGGITLLVVDWQVPPSTAEGFIRQVKEHYPRVFIIAVSAIAEKKRIQAARLAGAHAFLEKPLSVPEYLTRLRNLARLDEK